MTADRTGASAESSPDSSSDSSAESAESAESSATPSAQTRPAPVGPLFGTLLVALQFGIWLAILTPATVTLSIRVERLTPADKADNLGTILGIGVLFALVGSPLFGRLSDRTATRFGRRRSWILAGGVGTLLCLLVIATARPIPVVAVAWCCAQLCISAAFAASTALVPDKVSAAQRGLISGILGLTQPAATLAGTFVVQLVPPSSVLIFAAPAGVGVLLAVVFVVGVRDTEQPPSDRRPFGLREFARCFWVDPRRHPDFAWTFLSRFLVFLGFSVLLGYQAYFIIDHLHRPPAEVAHLVFLSTAATTVASLLSATVGGRLSDRVGRRRPFVFGSAAVAAGGFIGIAFCHTFGAFLVAATVVGLGQGLFLAVDLALVSAVLPDPNDSAKDIGVFNVANTLPQSIAPFAAPYVLAVGGGQNYPLLFLLAGGFGLLGAAAIYRVTGAR